MMKPLILISHGNLCLELKKSVEMIMGPQEEIYAVTLQPEEGQAEFLQKFKETIADIDEFVVFADLYGGTPCNVAAKMLLSGSNFKLYTGMNMAMIIDYLNAALLDTKPDPIKGGTQGICDVNASLQKLDGEDE